MAQAESTDSLTPKSAQFVATLTTPDDLSQRFRAQTAVGRGTVLYL